MKRTLTLILIALLATIATRAASPVEYTKADSINLYGGIALVAVVGRGMAGSKGTAGRIFKAIADNGINIRMIDQGSSELNIIVGVDADDYINTLDAIYREFVK